MAKIETNLRKRNEAVRALRECYSRALSYYPSARAMHAEIMEIKARHLGKSPQWTRSYFDGVADQLNKDLYQSRLIFGGMFEGVFYSTYSARDDYYQKHGIEPAEYADNGRVKARGHYWTDESGRVTKPYFSSEIEGVA